MKHQFIWLGKKDGYLCGACGLAVPIKEGMTPEIALGDCPAGIAPDDVHALAAKVEEIDTRLKSVEAKQEVTP